MRGSKARCSLHRVKLVGFPELQAVGFNQCSSQPLWSGQILQNVAAGACYYGGRVTVDLQAPWQTVEPY